jgi:hypothetical protein
VTQTRQVATADLLACDPIALAGESRAILGIAGGPGAGNAVWFVASEEAARVERLVARHIQFGKTPDEDRTWGLG